MYTLACPQVVDTIMWKYGTILWRKLRRGQHTRKLNIYLTNKLNFGFFTYLCDIFVPYTCQCGEETKQAKKTFCGQTNNKGERIQSSEMGSGTIEQSLGCAWHQKSEDSKLSF